jgi:hypothetical protein
MKTSNEASVHHGGAPGAHALIGLALAGVAITAAVAAGAREARLQARMQAVPEATEAKSPSLVRLLWPPALLALTGQGLKVWASPPGPSRSRALTLWSAGQMLAVAWTTLGVRRLGGPVTLWVAALATGAAFLLNARRVQSPASPPGAATLGWMGAARMLASPQPRSAEPVTIH